MRRRRVVVAMSGGVDSAVCAALLKEDGFEVIGITMQIWERSRDGSSCCGLESTTDARKVTYQLGIPHYVLNFRDVFREKVITDFCAEYQRGRTPNPCIRCNQHIKFDILLNRAKVLDADYIATGHYARIEFNPQTKRYLLKKGIDLRKDQSYVLYTMTQEQLSKTLMPLGNFTKARVRRIARARNLPVADKPESQEICFIPDNNYGAFIQRRIPREAIKSGPIVNQQGQRIGKHRGIVFYTVGQRKGIGIAESRPLYVTAIEAQSNTIRVGAKEQAYGRELIADNVNLISGEQLAHEVQAQVKIRYLHPPATASVVPLEQDRVKIKFTQPQWAVTPGQAAVFFQGDILLGGGIIN